MKLKLYGDNGQLWQWDTDQKMVVEDDGTCNEVHFCNRSSKTALVVPIREQNGIRLVDVPNILLQESSALTAYLYHYDADGSETRFSYHFPLRPRPKPEGYVYTETEVLNYASLDKRLNALEGEGLAQAVADYLKENPVQAGATAEEAAQIQQNKLDIEQLAQGKLDADKLPEAVNDALTQAKASGEFKGEPGNDGKTPVKGVDYFTEADKQEIAEMAAQLVEVPDSSENVNGLDATSSALLITILRNGVYNADQSANITALAAELGVVESDGGDTPDEPDEPEVPEVTLSSISATYNGGDVTAGTAVTDLTGIVVIAHYSDGSSEAVTGYTLSGTIAEGSNTVTVTYQGKTATFTVTGVAESGGDEPGVGVNLLENVTYIEGVNYYSGGQINADGYIGTDYIDVSSYEKLVLTTTSASWIDWKILWYTENKTFISESKPSTDGYLGTGYEESIELTIPENCKYIRSSNTETVMKALVVTAY